MDEAERSTNAAIEVNKAIERQQYVTEAYKNFARSEDGQIILQDLMDNFHITGPIFSVGEQSAFHNGERNVVLYILSQAQCKLGVKYE